MSSSDEWDASDSEVVAAPKAIPVVTVKKSKFANEDAEEDKEVKVGQLTT